jgi:hypothetical protein
VSLLGVPSHIGPGFVSVQRDPSLITADPGAIRGAAGKWAAVADRLAPVAGKISSSTHGLVGTSWLGLGALAYYAVAGQTAANYRLAAGVVGHVSNVLNALSADIEAAVSEAEQAEQTANAVNEASARLNTSFQSRTATVFGGLPFPTPAEASEADNLSRQAAQARSTMDSANRRARNAWHHAAAAFDQATGASPTVRAAVAAAKAKAEEEAKKKKHGGSIWGAIGNFALAGVLGIGDAALGAADVAQAGLDPITDGATVADTAATGEEFAAGMDALSGGAELSASEVAALEETAAENVIVDGASLDAAVVREAGQEIPEDYEWAPKNAPTDVLEPGEAWDPEQGTPVIGRNWDTKIVQEDNWPGHMRIQQTVSEWNPAKNDGWIQSIINKRGEVYTGSPLEGNLWKADEGEPSMFAHEVRQLLEAGYKWRGDWLIPP